MAFVIAAGPVIPAKAGTQADSRRAPRVSNTRWIPAFAGMTGGV
jgi:hypothetical protein